VANQEANNQAFRMVGGCGGRPSARAICGALLLGLANGFFGA